MGRYIDADKLIAKIVELRKELPDTIEHLNDEESGFARGQQYELTAIEAEILCLQQEQPETPSSEEVMTMCNQILIDWVKEGKTPEEREQREQAHIRFFELYDEYMQEQPEVDLEKEIIRYQREDMDRDTTVRDVARHFYELRLNARKGE